MIVKKARDPLLHYAIGREVRAFRTRYGIKAGDLALATNLSIGMLSKIESGDISPSLSTLQAISRSLAVPITWLVSRFETEHPAILVKGGGDTARDCEAPGQQCKSLGHAGVDANGHVVEPQMITLARETDVFPSVGNEGMVFLYLLQGAMSYRHGVDIYQMTPGDSLFFDATAQHGAEALTLLPIRCLSIASRRQDKRYD